MPTDVSLTEKELKMAKILVDSLITKFEPEKYENEYYKQVMELIDKSQETVDISEPSAPAGSVIGLMAALEANMKAIKEK